MAHCLPDELMDRLERCSPDAVKEVQAYLWLKGKPKQEADRAARIKEAAETAKAAKT